LLSLRPKIIDHSAKSQGFTLVELLISMLLGTIIVGAVIGILMVYVFDFEQTDDITAARQRGEMVLAILENPALHAGLGFPDSPDIFSDSTVEIKTWDGTVSIINSPSGVESGEIRVIYSVPSTMYTASSIDFETTDSIDIDATGIDLKKQDGTSITDLINIGDPYIDFSTQDDTIKHWIIFPTANSAFAVNDVGRITAENSGSGLIAQYDELHYLRTLEATVVDGEFKVRENLDGAGFQPRVDGIEQIYFKNSNGILTVYVLARGNKKDSDFATEVVHGWPSDEVAIDNAVKDKGYRLVTVRGSWRIRN